jgi:hypothetical protein
MQDALVSRVQAKFDTVRTRIEAKANLLKGIDMGDKALILASLARVEELQKEWGQIVPADAFTKAQEVLQIIAKEESTLDELRSALISNGLKGVVGRLDTSSIDPNGLEHVIQNCLASNVRISTQVGHNLIQSSQRVRDLRIAFLGADWITIESAIAAVSELRASGALAPEADSEVKLAESEVAERRILRAVTAALCMGAATGRVGELLLSSANTSALQSAVESAVAQSESFGGLSVTASALINCAKIGLRLRQALVSQDWSAVRRVVQEAGETRMPDVSLPEIQAAKDEADNHAIIHQLQDALERGHAVGTVAKLDIYVLDTTLLTERINHAEDIGPKTQKAASLLKLAKGIRRVRQALQNGEYGKIPELCKQAASITGDFVPSSTRDEILLAQYEAENIILINTLKEAIHTGSPTGIVGAVPRATINVSLIQAAIKKAQAIKCRSDEALWLFELAQAVLELRIGMYHGCFVSNRSKVRITMYACRLPRKSMGCTARRNLTDPRARQL